MAKSQNNETKDIRTKDGNLKFGHIHDDQVISSMMMQGQESLEFVTIDQIDPRKRWVWTRNRGRYQVISGDDIPEDQIAIYISSAGANGQSPGNIEMFSKGTIKIQAENIELIATGTDNNAGNITLQGNQNIRLEGGKEINMDSKESTSISAAADLNLTATNAMKNKAGHIQQETAASALKKPAFPVNGNTDFQHVTGQLFVTNAESKPKALGRGAARVDGSTYMIGPTQIGGDGDYSKVDATLMISNLKNADCATPDNALYVKGNITHEGDTQHTGDYTHKGNLKNSNLKNCTGQNNSFTSSRINVQSWKGFDISHPSKEGHRLRYVCLEGPEGGVYIRGRVKNQTEILLPEYWKNLVDTQSITVSLTPIGAHQDVIVKRWDENKIYLQAKGGMPIDCFYHIFAERKDGEKLIVEYQGQTPADYPGDSSQYSIAGYDYGRKQ